jgi:hypothetical protein
MFIFEREKRDGLEEVIKSTASIAFTTVAREISEPVKEISIKSLASANKDQKDLFYLDTVLVSTGWNQNEDVFLPKPTWEARKSPEDKQFNFMHNENDIIGHITGCYVADRNGNTINDEVVEIPQEFDIVTESVIYKAWSDPENRKRIEKIIAEIKGGQWYVSMECLFSGFNYAVIAPNGEHILLERNEASAYLSKHLRAYGGAGEYEGYKLGRALTGTSFSGKGLVNKPANPRSIILKTGASLKFTEENFTKDLLIVGEKNNMEDNVQNKIIEDLKAQLSKALAANESAQAEAFKKQEEALKQVTAEKAAVIADAEAKIKAEKDVNAKLQASLDEKVAELAKANETIDTIQKEQKLSARLARLVKAGFVDEEAKASVALYDALDDTAFESIVAKFEDFKKKDDKMKDEDKKKKDAEASKDGDGKDKETKKEEKKESKAEDKTEASAATFEDTKATASITDVEVDEVGKTRASISDWFGQNVLGLTDNKNGDNK